MKQYFHPKTWFEGLNEIDQQLPSYSLDRKNALRRSLIILSTVSLCLLFLNYAKFNSSFYLFLSFLNKIFSSFSLDLSNAVISSKWQLLFNYAWWTFCHLLAFVCFPFLVIRFILKDKIVNYGWRWQQTHAHWRGYLCLLLPILLFVYIASLGNDFVQHYPFYKLANRSWADFLAWEFLYILQFIFLEFFFRGFMIQSLRPALGANAIWIMCVPYMMIHLPKLWPEAFGAILFGFFLGLLAFQSRSIWGGVLVHAGIAISMDIAALLRTHGLPIQFWP